MASLSPPSTRPGISAVALASLAFLTLQNCANMLVILISKTQPGLPYSTAILVALGELAKAFVSVALIYATGEDSQYRQGLLPAFQSTLPVMLVPAGIYSIQNQLFIGAGAYLSSPVLVASNQLKLVMAGVFSYVLLGRILTARQWGAVLALCCGVMMVTWPSDASSSSSPSSSWGTLMSGLTLMLGATACSGFAGVYTEKQLKQVEVGIYMRNLQLAVGGSLVAVATALLTDAERLWGNPLEGFTGWAWLLLLLHVAAGFLVALCLKYGDAVVKNFATSCSLALTVIVSWPVFGDPTTLLQAMGTCVIIGAVYIYTQKA